MIVMGMLVYKPHEYYSYLRIINPNVIEVMFTNLAIVWGLTLYLVGGFKHKFYFPFHIWDVILPIDIHVFQDGYCTTNKISYSLIVNGIYLIYL